MARSSIPIDANAHRGTYLPNGTLLIDFAEKPLMSKPAPDASNAAALVLMSKPNAAVVRMALSAGVRAVCAVLPQDEALAARIEQTLPHDPRVSCKRITDAEAKEMRCEARNYELFGVPAHLLLAGRELVHASGGAHDLLILDGNQTAIRARHVRELCGRLAAIPDTDVVTSWIIWFRRMPLLVAQRYLDTLDERLAAARACEPGYGPIQHLHVQEVVFGEEPLAAKPQVNNAAEDFFAQCRLSALEAVRLARASQEYERARMQAEKAADGACAAGKPANNAPAGENVDPLASLKPAELQLVALAKETLGALEPARSALEPALADADRWGARNRQDFPLLSDTRQSTLVYLDSAATTQRCFRALAAEQNFSWHENANVYRGGYSLSLRATETLNDARKVIEDFIGAERRTTVLTSNTTDGLNLVAQGWGMRNIARGDLIVCTIAEHHSNMLPWQLLARERKARIAYVPIDACGRIDREAFSDALRMNPKLVCLAHASNVLGQENPIEQLAAAAHEAGARVVIDGAQGFPHFGANVHALEEAGVDFYAFSSHKVYGPTGMGGLWISKRAFAEMEPLSSGGGAISHVSPDSHYWRLGTIRFEPGTPDVAAACGFAGAIEYLSSLGMEPVRRHADALAQYLVSGLRTLDYVSIWGAHGNAFAVHGGGAHDSTADATQTQGTFGAESGTVSFSVAGVAPGIVGRTLGKLGVAIRSGGHCAFPLSATLGLLGTARVSIGVYNTAEDIEAALVAVRMCRKLACGCC